MESSMPIRQPVVSLSVVSHGQGHLVEALLKDVRRWTGTRIQIIVTLNIFEDQKFLQSFSDLDIFVISNATPKGFGANHNAAFAQASGEIFVVINPDIRAHELDLGPLVETAASSSVGACAPLVLSVDGKPEDSARRFPTITRLAKRIIFKKRSADFEVSSHPTVVDWVAGMFVVFRSEVFKRVGGFDERYFMYMEDVDICRRLKRHELSVVVDPRCKVIHDARRASRRDPQHLRWHIRSAIRYLFHV
jgi:N-acetylglucosaminyl-diphospho-decaprenol L-rhamnosyltransferase